MSIKVAEALSFNSIAEELNQSNTDRAVAVLGGSLVETALQNLLLSKFAEINEVKDFVENANTASLRKIALGIGIIPMILANEMKIIAKIRNEFAHNRHYTD